MRSSVASVVVVATSLVVVESGTVVVEVVVTGASVVVACGGAASVVGGAVEVQAATITAKPTARIDHRFIPPLYDSNPIPLPAHIRCAR